MNRECEGCMALLFGYCPGDYCEKFSGKNKNMEDDYLEVEKIEDDTLRKNSYP
jgi:hypothetical protein